MIYLRKYSVRLQYQTGHKGKWYEILTHDKAFTLQQGCDFTALLLSSQVTALRENKRMDLKNVNRPNILIFSHFQRALS